MSRWACSILEELLSHKPQVERSEQDFAFSVAAAEIMPSDMSVQMDVKELFMSGSVFELTESVKRVIPWRSKKWLLLLDVVYWMLAHQYIVSDIAGSSS